MTIGDGVVGLVGTPWIISRIIRNFVDDTNSVSTSRLLASAVGLIVGLIVAMLISIPVSRVAGCGAANRASLFFAYLGAMIMSAPSRDMFKRIVPEQETRDSSLLNGVGTTSSTRVAWKSTRSCLS